MHLVILLLAGVLFAFLSHAQAASLADQEELQTTMQVEEERPNDFDMTVTNVGDNDQIPLANNVDRIEDVVVPGTRVDLTQATGIPGAFDGAARHDVPPPPGAGSGPGGALPTFMGDPVMRSTFRESGNNGSFFDSGFPGRSPSTRQKMLDKYGGSRLSEASVGRGLEWLALHQAQDGHWSLHEFNHSAREKPRPAGKIRTCNCEVGTTQRNDIAATGFGLLPFLAGGITHKPTKPTNKDYSKTVKAGLNWLMSKQGKDGSYSSDMYAHGIATIALCEAYGLTSDPVLKRSAQLALNFIVSAQDPAGGGWRYAPKQAGDTSVTGWQLMALKSGQMAGLECAQGHAQVVRALPRLVRKPPTRAATATCPAAAKRS